MTEDDTKATLDSLLARRGNTPEFIAELEGYRQDLATRDLDGADRKYIRELAKRLGGGGAASDPIESLEDDHEDEYEDEDEDEDSEGDSRFAQAKAAFFERFNPDGLDPDAPDTAIRRQIYEDFRAELERIEEQ